ncbi:MAG: hypothetical protein JWQ29_951 [Phenylobacterium sp.]|nr:hypothetical protein [Phenylobacterium sp.]
MARTQIDRRHALVSAAIEAVVGLVITLALAAIVYSSNLNQAGADLSQRLLLALSAPGGALGVARHDEDHALRAPPQTWVFVDLGGAFCNPGQGAQRCPPYRLRTDREALSRLLAKVLEQGPRVVVLDVLTDRAADGDVGDAALRKVLSQARRPVLLAWSPNEAPRAAGRPLLNALDQQLLFPLGGADGFPNARYLPAMKHMSGPAARQLGPDYDVASEGSISRAPGIAYAAALVARSPDADPWALVRRFDTARQSDLCPIRPASGCEPWRRTDRVFSFPATKPDSDPVEVLADRAPAFVRVTPGLEEPLPASLAGAVVVIGNSQSEGDRSWSAVGDVSGAELILNDIRQFAAAPPEPAPPAAVHLLHEWPFFLAGAVAMFFGNAVVNLRWPHPPPRPPGTRPSLGHTLRLALQSASRLGLTALLSIALFLPVAIYGGGHFGRPPDFVTPFVGILLDSLFELLHRSSQFLHRLLHALLLGRAPPHDDLDAPGTE